MRNTSLGINNSKEEIPLVISLAGRKRLALNAITPFCRVVQLTQKLPEFMAQSLSLTLNIPDLI